MSGKAYIAVDLALLKRMFCLPESYTITRVLEPSVPHMPLRVIVESPDLPDIPGPDGITVPQIELHHTVMTHPEQPAFKLVETRVTMDGKDITHQ